ncbi:hypothetical protein B0I10_102131 [Flavobacterium lacus]|uniref:Uncharacterized protein n=1 Tax=Flavobacterium lacus TaxID=1353778 RepID=A0A328WVZ2_9FLAO|nr:hypothetical protein B0I10_102131 [Flavobacterium lacus]
MHYPFFMDFYCLQNLFIKLLRLRFDFYKILFLKYSDFNKIN